MPIYEYEVVGGKCNICKGRFELRRPLSVPPLEKCPLCKKPVRKLVSRTNVQKDEVGDAKKAGFTVLQKRDKGVYEKL